MLKRLVCHQSAGKRVALTGMLGSARCVGGRTPAHGIAIVLCLGILAMLSATGCAASRNLVLVQDEAQFRSTVLESDKPVLVDFYKGGGCPTCQFVVPILNQLAEEYHGRVTFVQFEYMKPYFVTTSDEISSRYKVGLFPTVVLINQGQETNRWSLDYSIDDYRQALDAALKERRIPAAVAWRLSAGRRRVVRQEGQFPVPKHRIRMQPLGGPLGAKKAPGSGKPGAPGVF